MLFLGACTSPNNAGEEVIPPDDLVGVNYTDTFTIGFKTIVVDSVVTARLSRCLIGNYLDEQFGMIDCETYIQPRLKGSNLVYGEASQLRLDSIVLVLDLLDFYGHYNDALELEVFEINQDFKEDSLYTSRNSMNADYSYDYANGQKLDFSGLPGFFDFVSLRLDDSLGRKLLFAPVDSLASQGAFSQFFNGLLIRTKAVDPQLNREPGGVFAFDPRSTKTSLVLHYHKGSTKDFYAFTISDASARFHKITRSDVAGRTLDMATTTVGTNAPYGCFQSGAVVKLAVEIPYLKNLDPAGINRAELVLPVDPAFFGSEERFDPPPTIFMYVADSTGEKELDLAQFNSTATYDASRKAYIMSVTNTVQQILAGRLPNNGFLIVPGNNGVTLNRAVIGGPGHPTLPAKLRVMYTKINQ